MVFTRRWAAVVVALSIHPLYSQYDKVAALGSDSALTPIGGPASAPPVSSEPYGLGDLRPTGAMNDRLPAWLQFGLDERLRWEDDRDAYLLNRLRVGMILQPASWLKAVAQVQDARSFLQTPPIGPPNNVRWDLKLAYAQFGDAERQPVSVSVGRQLIDFNHTLIGNSEWRNQARSYDGVVVQVHENRIRLALFAASVVNPQLNGISHHREGNNVYGAYGWITRVVPHSSMEPFVLWRVAPLPAGRLSENAYGLRVRGTGIANFDYRYELTLERGGAGSKPIRAWATTGAVGYTLASYPWRPRLFAGYDFASGDRNPAGGVRGTFDTLYPTAHDRFGIADQFGWQNILAGRGGGTLHPYRRLSVTAQYLDLWLASAKDGAYNSSGGMIVRDASGMSGRHLGEEFDLYAWYEINRQVHVGSGIGHLRPGSFLAAAGKSAPYTYPYFVIEMFDGKRIR